MMRLLGSLILFLVFAVIAQAGHTLRSDGYYYDGHNPQPYTRVSYYNASSYGCCGYYSYSYVPYYAPTPAYVAPVVPTYTPDWKIENIKYKAQLADYEAYLQAVGRAAIPQAAAVTYNQHFAAQASTAYGSNFNQQFSAYGDVDVNAALQAYARVVSQVNTAGSTAEQSLGSVTAQALGDKLKHLEVLARIREIETRGATAVAVIRALEEKKIIINNSGGFSFSPNPSPPQVAPNPNALLPQENGGGEADLEKLGAVMQSKCASCHSSDPKTMKGKLDLTQWRSFDRAKKTSIYNRLITEDAERMMPRAADGGPGTRLSFEEIKLFAPK